MKQNLVRLSAARALRAKSLALKTKKVDVTDVEVKVKVKNKEVEQQPAVVYPALDSEQQRCLDTLLKVKSYVLTQVFERERETEGSLIALLSGTSVLLLGEPGAGKTHQIRLISRLLGLSVFDTLISETTKPDSIFGPPDVPALARGFQRVKIKGYAPDCEVLFFDEIFKASGVVLNPLLWLINEHEFRNGDDGILKCPTKAVFAASNEIPTDDGLKPIYDRFLLRYQVNYLRNRSSLNSMLAASHADHSDAPTLTREDLELLRKLVPSVVVPDDVRDSVYALRDLISRSVGLTISDRRLVKSFAILRSRALLHGRMYVTKADLEVLTYVFWQRPDQIAKVRALALSVSNARMSDIVAYEELVSEIWEHALKNGDIDHAKKRLTELRESASRFKSDEGAQVLRMIDEYLGRIDNIHAQRGNFIVVMMKQANGDVWFQVGRGTDSLWSPQQLRSVKFRLFRKGNYWWQEGYTHTTTSVKRKKAKRLLREAIASKLNVNVQFTKM